MNIIETYSINRNNIHIDNELKPNEAIIVCNHYIMEQLSKKGVTFDEMYPGVFIVTSLNGNSTMQDIEKINRLIRLYNPELMDESNLVAQMSQEKMDAFFQNHFWSDREKKKMHIKSVEYRGNRFDIDPGSLIAVSYTHLDKMRNACIKSYNKFYEVDTRLKEKQKGRNQDISVNDMKNYKKIKKQLDKNAQKLAEVNNQTEK